MLKVKRAINETINVKLELYHGSGDKFSNFNKEINWLTTSYDYAKYYALSLRDEMNEGRSLKTKYFTGMTDGIEIAIKVFQGKYNINEKETKEYIDKIRKEFLN